MMKNRITILMVGILMISCVLLEEKLGGEDPELVFYIVPELEVNIGGYYLLPLNTNNTNITNQAVYAYVGYKDFDNFDY